MRFPLPSRIVDWVIIASIVAATACSRAPELDNTGTVAKVGSESLSGSELTALLLNSPQSPDRVIASGMVSMWIDYAMVMEAVNARMDLTSDEVLREISTPEMMERSINAYASQRGLRGASPSEGQVDSLIRGGQVRVFRMYRFPVAPDRDSVAKIRSSTLYDIYTMVVNGKSIDEAIASQSKDAVAGLTVDTAPATTYEEMPADLAKVIWRLKDLEISPPMSGNGGVQLIQRLPAKEARAAYAAWLQPKLQQAEDRRFTDSLIADKNIELVNDGVARIRSALAEPLEIGGTEPLVSWQGGEVTPTEALGWISGLLPAERARLAIASEVTLTDMGTNMARREIFFALAATSPEVDTAAIRAEVMTDFRVAIPQLWDGVTSRTTKDGAVMGMALSWMTATFAGERPYLRLPGTLGGWLRERITLEFDGEALETALRAAGLLWVDPNASESKFSS